MKIFFIVLLILLASFFIVCGGMLISFKLLQVGIPFLIIGFGIAMKLFSDAFQGAERNIPIKTKQRKKTPKEEMDENFSNFKGL